MPSPAFDKALHDVGIAGKGYMLVSEGRVVRQDAVPATSRAALGEGRYDLFQADSFAAQATWAGGAGQSRMVATDAYLSGVCDSRWAGHLFPARKLIGITGSASSFFFHRDATVYGFHANAIYQLGSATTFAGGGNPRHQPVVDGNNDVFYVTTTNALYKWTGSGVATNITANLGTGVTPYVVTTYHRYLWCLAMQNYEATPTTVQHKAHAGVAKMHGYALNARPRSGNLLTLAIATGSAATVDSVPEGWILAYSNTNNANIQTHLYYKAAEPNESRGGQITLSAAQDAVIVIAEWEGMDARGILNTQNGNSGAAVTSIAPGSITTTEADTIVILFHAGDAATALAPPAGYTELVEASITGTRAALSYKVLSATATENPTATATTSGNLSALIMAFKGNTITTDTTRFVPYYSSDGGNTWDPAFSETGTGVETPTAAHAAGGSLWFTTPRGLYQMGVDDEEYVDGHVKLNVFLRGKIDTFNYPSNAANVGLWIGNWQGALYYGVGQTVRSFPLGAAGSAEGRQVWPTEDWGTSGGNVAALVTGEGGVYFGADGILWCYNQRGFHPLATTTAASYNHLYWHNGRLYVAASGSAQYYDFGYPSLRPDASFTAPTNFETGYWVSSEIDFEKLDVSKFLSQFQTSATFTDLTSTGGTITLEYLITDVGAQPGREGGSGSVATWTVIGTHAGNEGNIKTFTPTPIKAKAIRLRATLTPGTSGYPILKAVVVNGRSIMPTVKRFVIDLDLTSGANDKASTQIYPNTASVWAAVDELNDLRNGTDTFTLTIVEPDGGTSAYTVTAEQMQDSIIKAKKINRAVAGTAQFVATQLPGTSVTEVRP